MPPPPSHVHTFIDIHPSWKNYKGLKAIFICRDSPPPPPPPPPHTHTHTHPTYSTVMYMAGTNFVHKLQHHRKHCWDLKEVIVLLIGHLHRRWWWFGKHWLWRQKVAIRIGTPCPYLNECKSAHSWWQLYCRNGQLLSTNAFITFFLLVATFGCLLSLLLMSFDGQYYKLYGPRSDCFLIRDCLISVHSVFFLDTISL